MKEKTMDDNKPLNLQDRDHTLQTIFEVVGNLKRAHIALTGRDDPRWKEIEGKLEEMKSGTSEGFAKNAQARARKSHQCDIPYDPE